ncbi:MAG: hypothetical protein NVS3B14_21640 [Ktedonobacteraceae bacterium]
MYLLKGSDECSAITGPKVVQNADVLYIRIRCNTFNNSCYEQPMIGHTKTIPLATDITSCN